MFYKITRGLRRGGLMPACSFLHVRNGRGCRPIEAVYATVLPRRALKRFHGCVRLRRVRGNTCTLRRGSLRIDWLKAHGTKLRVFWARTSFLCHSTSVRLLSRRHNNSSKQQQCQPNILADTVVVVELGRSLYFIYFPAAS